VGALLIFLIETLAKLPLPVRSFLGRAAGSAFSIFPTRERKIAKLQLEKFLPRSIPRPSIRQMYANLGQSAFEAINLNPLLADLDSYVEPPVPGFYEGLKKDGRGIVALTAHVSNWDLLAAVTIAQGLELVTVGRRARNPHLQSLLDRIRRSYRITTVWRDDKRAARDLIDALKAGKVVAALIDQDVHVAGTFVPFFGRPVRTPSSLIPLAQRYRARIYSTFIVRTGFLRYRVIAEEFDTTLPVEAILEEYHRRLEKVICQYPDQWVWIHKRWRTPKEGETMSSKSYLEFLKEGLKQSSSF
jgi:Kdo2-lipid IVA lauroyltransferase/acyltransferase